MQQLSGLFEELLSKLKPSGNRTMSVAPSTSPSPALPLVAAINVRLMLLRPDHTHLVRLEEGAEMTVNESKMMHCEAVRRLSLAKWPHKDYVYVVCVLVVWFSMLRLILLYMSLRWAVPKTMASAGFYHLVCFILLCLCVNFHCSLPLSPPSSSFPSLLSPPPSVTHHQPH